MRTYLVIGTCCALAFAAALVLDQAPAKAFPFPNSWHLTAHTPEGASQQVRCGAAGIYGTGSPSEFGIRCVDCHIKPAGLIGLEITASPPFQVSGNSTLYAPGQSYDIQVKMTGEHLAMNDQFNLNGFAAAFEAADGATMGTLIDSQNVSSVSCPSGDPGDVAGSGRTMIYGDCHGVIFMPEDHDDTWSFKWNAPNAGAGEVTMWYGAVDGDNNGKSSLDDDTIQGNLVLEEGS